MEHALLEVIDAECERECGSIRAAAEGEASAILDRARTEAEHLLRREPPVPSDVGSNPEVGARRREFLETYRTKVTQLREATLALLLSSSAASRDELLAGLVRDTVRRAIPSALRVRAPAAVWSAIEQEADWHGGRAIERAVSGGPTVLVESRDGQFRAAISIEGAVSRYFETEAERVAALLLGHDAP